MKAPPNTLEVTGDTAKLTVTMMDGRKVSSFISAADTTSILKHKWYYHTGRYFYTKDSNGRPLSLHRLIIGKPAGGEETDHIDRNKLNNTRGNLRIVTIATNRRNRLVSNPHGFPGLHYIPDRKGYKNKKMKNPWQVRLRIKDQTANTDARGNKTRLLSIGTYPTKEAAIEARRKAEEKYYGMIFH